MRIGLAIGCSLAVMAQFARTQDAAQPAPPPEKVVLQNLGRPIVTPFQCSEADLHWAGMSCSDDEPCPVFLELSAVAAAGPRILAAGNIHTDSVTLYSVLLSSDDAGKTWSEAAPRLRGAGLDRIEIAGTGEGWIAGQELFPLPQNPFLLRSTDGGVTWIQKPVFTENDETRFGSVQQFAFTSSQEGSLVVDRGHASASRYGTYRTHDGGETWGSQADSARPPRLETPTTPPDWRVRVDGPARAFRIERREGASWLNVASFAVRLDPCKPPPSPVDAGAGEPK